MKRGSRLIAVTAALMAACGSDAPKGKAPAPDAGGDVSLPDGGAGSDSATPNVVSDEPFVMTQLGIAGTEQGERVVFRASGLNVKCGAMPTMELALTGAQGQVVTAIDCDEYGFTLDFAPTVPPALYRPVFVNGDGRGTDQPHELTFEVYERLGMTQAPLAPGLRPSLASNWESSAAVIGAIDPDDGTVFFLPRLRDFTAPFPESSPEPHPRTTTTIVANEVHVGSTGEDNPAYIAVWASDTAVGVLWLDGFGRIIDGGPPALPASAPTQLDIARDDRFGWQWAVVWRDAARDVYVALVENGEADWVIPPALVGNGDWPRVARGGNFGDYTVAWSPARGESYARAISGSAFDDGPIGEAELIPYNRANCDYSPEGLRFWICEDFGYDSPRVLVYDGDSFVLPPHAAPQLQHPASIATEPDNENSTLSFHVAYADTLGGTTYESYRWTGDGPVRALGRHAQRASPTPPDIDFASNSLGEFFTWVAEVDGVIELGSIRRPPR